MCCPRRSFLHGYRPRYAVLSLVVTMTVHTNLRPVTFLVTPRYTRYKRYATRRVRGRRVRHVTPRYTRYKRHATRRVRGRRVRHVTPRYTRYKRYAGACGEEGCVSGAPIAAALLKPFPSRLPSVPRIPPDRPTARCTMCWAPTASSHAPITQRPHPVPPSSPTPVPPAAVFEGWLTKKGEGFLAAARRRWCAAARCLLAASSPPPHHLLTAS